MNRSQVEAYHCDVIPFCTTQWSERHLNKAEPEYSEFILWLFVTLNWNTRTVNYKTKGTMTSCGLHCLPDVYLHDDHSRLKPDRQSSCFTLSQNASKHIPLMFSKVKAEKFSWLLCTWNRCTSLSHLLYLICTQQQFHANEYCPCSFPVFDMT